MINERQAKYRLDYTPPSHSVDWVELLFDLDKDRTVVTSLVHYSSQTETDSLELSGRDLEIISIKVDGEEFTSYKVDAESLTLSDLPLEFTLEITTACIPSQNSSLEGLYVSDGALSTQCEAEGFRRITYYLDRPDISAPFKTTIRGCKKLYPYLLSNGNRVESGSCDGGKHWVVWEDPYPKPSYLFALVAGDFDLLEESYKTVEGRDVLLQIFVDRGKLSLAGHAMESLKAAMDWDEKRWGLAYDLDIYMIVAVDFFNMGAMENKGLNVFNSRYVLADGESATDRDFENIESVIGHEYFHNWTGNRVTCRDWFQLSLKEGLTVFRDQEFSSDMGSRAVHRISAVRTLRTLQFAEDSGPLAHPVRPEKVLEMNNFYTVTIYEKGSEIIRMIHLLLGEELFKRGLKLYLDRFDGTAATCEDFIRSMEEISNIDLSQFRRWYSQAGTPFVKVSSTYDSEKSIFTLKFIQENRPTADGSPKEPLHIPIAVQFYSEEGDQMNLISSDRDYSTSSDKDYSQAIISLRDDSKEFTFLGVDKKPTVALFCGFSAPVKWDYNYSEADLGVLISYSNDPFVRWEAAQRVVGAQLRRAISSIEKSGDIEEGVEWCKPFEPILNDRSIDPAFLSELLSFPTDREISSWYEVVPVDAIREASSYLKRSFAQTFSDILYSRYREIEPTANRDAEAVGNRALRGTLLSFLAHLPQGDELVAAHYSTSQSMSDTMSALSVANMVGTASRDQLLSDFESRWRGNSLVMDKWFTLQATAPRRSLVKQLYKLMEHPDFSIGNPNRVRSLIGSFCANNPYSFHSPDGEGYSFLSDIIIRLNAINPQVAARMVEPLLDFKRYDDKRSASMISELNKISSIPSLSVDLREKVEKALAQIG